jgi:hypothetical protein
MIHNSNVLRGTLDVNEVKTGAPMVTPNAYSVTVSADIVTDMCKSSAMRGSSPTLMNSVVPIAKALTARASNGHILPFDSGDMFFPPIYRNLQPTDVIMSYSSNYEQYVLFSDIGTKKYPK